MTIHPAAETARVVTLVSSITLAADLLDFEPARRALAPLVRVDYSSLWGGEAVDLTPDALLNGWRGLLPGFDATRHLLSDVEAAVDGDSATATARVDATHWLDGATWRVIGTYAWTLTKRDGRWAVTAMTFGLTGEEGDRSLVARAGERAAARS